GFLLYRRRPASAGAGNRNQGFMAGELCKIVKALAGWVVCGRHRVADGRTVDGRGGRGGSECAHFSSGGVVPASRSRERRSHRQSIGCDVRETAHAAKNGLLRWNTRGKQNTGCRSHALGQSRTDGTLGERPGNSFSW